MIILDPDPSTDCPLTRSTSAYYWDAAGALQQEAPNRVRVTYDPADLAAPPYALVEREATNYVKNNTMVGAVVGVPGTRPTGWALDWTAISNGLSRSIVGLGTESGIEYVDVRFQGTATATGTLFSGGFDFVAASIGQTWVVSSFCKLVAGAMGGARASVRITEANSGGVGLSSSTSADYSPTESSLAQQRLSHARALDNPGMVNILPILRVSGVTGEVYDFTLRVGLPQLERDRLTSPVKTTTASVTRAADVLGTGTFLRSSIIENDAPAYDAAAAYVVNENVLDAANHLIYASNAGTRNVVTLTIASPCVVNWTGHGQVAGTPFRLSTTGALPTGPDLPQVYYVLAPAANTFTFSTTPGGAPVAATGSQSGVHSVTVGNVGKALTDTTAWRQVSATNARKMVDQSNSSQSIAPEEILVVMRAESISQGFYLGNLEGVFVSITSVDPDNGLVYSEERNQTTSNSASSFFKWHVQRLRRKNYFFSALLPIYAKALVTVRIRNPGAIAKCGVCVLGALEDIGLSQYGLASEIKDYSTIKFNVDGTSNDTIRGYARRMSLDILLPNSQRDAVEDNLIRIRQKNVLFVGSYLYGSAIVYGKYGSFKNLLENFANSKCNLQINGTV